MVHHFIAKLDRRCRLHRALGANWTSCLVLLSYYFHKTFLTWPTNGLRGSAEMVRRVLFKLSPLVYG